MIKVHILGIEIPASSTSIVINAGTIPQGTLTNEHIIMATGLGEGKKPQTLLARRLETRKKPQYL